MLLVVRVGEVLVDVLTVVDELFTGVAVLVRVVVVPRIVVPAVVLRVVVPAVVLRVVVVLVVRVAVPRVAVVAVRVAAPAAVRVTLEVRTLVLPYVLLRVTACEPVRVEVWLIRIPGAIPLAADASRTAVRRLDSNARAFCILRDALRVANERSG